MNLSVVIPVLDEAKCLGPFLEMLRERLGEGDQIIVVDGGSSDNSGSSGSWWGGCCGAPARR